MNPEALLSKKALDEKARQKQKEDTKSSFSFSKIWKKLTTDNKVKEREERLAMC